MSYKERKRDEHTGSHSRGRSSKTLLSHPLHLQGSELVSLELRTLGLEPEDVAMVGDDPESDVAGARACGLRGVQVETGKYRPEGGVEADLSLESIAGLPDVLGI